MAAKTPKISINHKTSGAKFSRRPLNAVSTSEMSELFVEDTIKPIIEACEGKSSAKVSVRPKELWQFDPHGDDIDDDFEPVSECVSVVNYRSKSTRISKPDSVLRKKPSRSMKRQPLPVVNSNNNSTTVALEDKNINQSPWAGSPLVRSTVLRKCGDPDEMPNTNNWMNVTAALDEDHTFNLRFHRDCQLRYLLIGLGQKLQCQRTEGEFNQLCIVYPDGKGPLNLSETANSLNLPSQINVEVYRK